MTRKRFSERQVIETLLYAGVTIVCRRCHVAFQIGDQIEREHLIELALGGPDEPRNCMYSHKACHAIVTNGTKATSAGSSKHKIAKVKRIVEARSKGGYARAMDLTPKQRSEIAQKAARARWGSPKIKSRGFPKVHRPMRGKRT